VVKSTMWTQTPLTNKRYLFKIALIKFLSQSNYVRIHILYITNFNSNVNDCMYRIVVTLCQICSRWPPLASKLDTHRQTRDAQMYYSARSYMHNSFTILYRVSQGERSIFREVTVSAILSMKKCIYTCVKMHCRDEQHAKSAHELRSALMLPVEFSKMYSTR
jgi:hypothetical protein